jgi:hypothetical protein
VRKLVITTAEDQIIACFAFSFLHLVLLTMKIAVVFVLVVMECVLRCNLSLIKFIIARTAKRLLDMLIREEMN